LIPSNSVFSHPHSCANRYSTDPTVKKRLLGHFKSVCDQFQLNVIHLEERAFQKFFDIKIRIAMVIAGVGGAGGQGHVSLRS